ncbi:helix-turn-helix domain-containing protein [Streptomyces omiyaensis]|uniref:helix-turn-helix domain-containing protein n=1 Tax=Streptomyces omiyaensis TaxID=68247 RepID=UPI0036F7D8F9
MALRRTAAGLSQSDLGQKSGVSKAHMSMIARGRANASAPVIARIAAALDCTISDLLPPPAKPES